MQISPLRANLGASAYAAKTSPSFGTEIYNVSSSLVPFGVDLALINKKSSREFETAIELLDSLPYQAYEDLVKQVKSPEGYGKDYTNYENYKINLNARRFEVKGGEKCERDGQFADCLGCGSIPAALILAPLHDRYFMRNISPTYDANISCAYTINGMMGILDKYITALQEGKMPSKARLIEADVFKSMGEVETKSNIITPGMLKEFYDLYKCDKLSNDYICSVLQHKAIALSLF